MTTAVSSPTLDSHDPLRVVRLSECLATGPRAWGASGVNSENEALTKMWVGSDRRPARPRCWVLQVHRHEADHEDT